MKLIPPDIKQCQAEKPSGHTFMTLGGRPGLVRCSNKPTYVITETKKGADGKRGSMSLCDSCLAVAINQLSSSAFTMKKVGK